MIALFVHLFMCSFLVDTLIMTVYCWNTDDVIDFYNLAEWYAFSV